jgi:hypothetical protein
VQGDKWMTNKCQVQCSGTTFLQCLCLQVASLLHRVVSGGGGAWVLCNCTGVAFAAVQLFKSSAVMVCLRLLHQAADAVLCCSALLSGRLHAQLVG